MRSLEQNIFNDGKLYQMTKNRDLIFVSDYPTKSNFAIDKKNMDKFLLFSEKNKEYEIKEDGLKYILKSQTQQLTLNVYDGSFLEMPELYKNVNEPEENFVDENPFSKVKVDVSKLKNASKFVATGNNAKPVLTGVCVGNYIIGTDSFSLYRAETANNLEDKVLLTTAFIDALPSGEIELYFDKNTVLYRGDSEIIIGRLLEGRYPDVSKIYSQYESIDPVVVNSDDIKSFIEYSAKPDADIIELSTNKMTIIGEINSECECELNIAKDDTFKAIVSKLLTVLKQLDGNIEIKVLPNGKMILINNTYVLLGVA